METQPKKGFWKNASPTLTFVLGLISGIAVFSLISFLLLSSAFLQLQRPTGALGESTPADAEVVVDEEVDEEEVPPVGGFASFDEVEGEICRQDGKPIIRLFSTTGCSYCARIKDTFDSVVKEYVKAGKIVAYHWEFDIGDDSLTPEKEGGVPASEEAVYLRFNPQGYVPAFVFGCKYSRVGLAYEDLEAEAADFRAVIDKLLE